MRKFAVLNDNLVSNIIIANSLSVAEQITASTCIEILGDTAVDIGYKYLDDQFVNPTELEEE